MRNRRVLFSNFCLAYRSGTEMFLWDLIRGLQAKGWECGVYTPRMGEFAGEFQHLNIPVWNRLEEITMEPDVLHCQHTLESLTLSAKFPGVPAIFMVHDARSWHDTIPAVSRWSALVAVDEACGERIMRETGLRREQIEIVPNAVDTARFLPRDPLPETPATALVFTSYASHDQHVSAARELCQRLGITLEVIGPATGQLIAEPEHLLPKYDLVFGKGRCALEAMAVGSAVILIGPEGTGEMVTPENFAGFKKRNFGFSLLSPGMDQNFLEKQVKRYSPAIAGQVQAMVRNTCSLDSMVDAIIRLYDELPARTLTTSVLRDTLPLPVVTSLITEMLQEHATVLTDYQRTVRMLDQNVLKLRERAERYQATTRKYKTKTTELKQKLSLKKPRKVPLWERLKLRFKW